MTTWSPDTCGCVIDYVMVDGDNEPIIQSVQLCPAHTDGADDAERGANVLAENRRKNRALALAEEAGAKVAEWFLDSDRVVHLRLGEGADKAAVQAAVGKHLPDGVVVE